MSSMQPGSQTNAVRSALRFVGRGTPFRHHPAPKPGTSVVATEQETTTFREVPTNRAHSRLSRSTVLQRSTVKTPSQKPIRTYRSLTQKILFAMAVVIFIAGAGVAAMSYRTNKNATSQLAAISQKNEEGSSESTNVSEEKPSEAVIGSYSVAPNLPKYLTITKLGIHARIMGQGITKTGALKAPGNVHDAGWYQNSSRPGENGAVLLDGHVSGPTQHGVFYDAKKLVPGDKIQVERGDGKVFTYTVQKSVTKPVDQTNMADALVSVNSNKPGLNLMTCTGKFNASTGKYEQRLTVFATQDS